MGLCSKKVTSSDGTLDCSQSLTLHTEAIKCPRCESTNTKFCYYNNYSKTQPRYFCKSCKRHWTEGGTLRNIPVGGGRKNRNRRLKTLAPKAAAAHSNRVNSQMPEADHLNNNEAILRQPSSGFQLQDSGFSSVNKLLDGDHLLRGPIPGSFQSFAMEDSSVKAMMPSTSSSITWQAVGNNGEMDYWNWDDIDYLVTTDLNISSWDDATDVKP